MNTLNVPTYIPGSEVITEGGLRLGWVRNVIVARGSTRPVSLILSPIAILWLPEKLIGSYELRMDDIISLSANRIIVFDGITDRLKPITLGWLERIGWIKPSWKKSPNTIYLWPPSPQNDDDCHGPSPIPAPRPPSPNPLSQTLKDPSQL